jgi:hypothetical protein
MFKVISFLTKKAGLTLEEFRHYYENHHIPLVLSIATAPPLYKRRYIRREEQLTDMDAHVDFDAITELGFPDEATFIADWVEPLVRSEKSHLIGEDEKKFLNRALTRAYIFDEHVTTG